MNTPKQPAPEESKLEKPTFSFLTYRISWYVSLSSGFICFHILEALYDILGVETDRHSIIGDVTKNKEYVRVPFLYEDIKQKEVFDILSFRLRTSNKTEIREVFDARMRNLQLVSNKGMLDWIVLGKHLSKLKDDNVLTNLSILPEFEDDQVLVLSLAYYNVSKELLRYKEIEVTYTECALKPAHHTLKLSNDVDIKRIKQINKPKYVNNSTKHNKEKPKNSKTIKNNKKQKKKQKRKNNRKTRSYHKNKRKKIKKMMIKEKMKIIVKEFDFPEIYKIYRRGLKTIDKYLIRLYTENKGTKIKNDYEDMCLTMHILNDKILYDSVMHCTDMYALLKTRTFVYTRALLIFGGAGDDKERKCKIFRDPFRESKYPGKYKIQYNGINDQNKMDKNIPYRIMSDFDLNWGVYFSRFEKSIRPDLQVVLTYPGWLKAKKRMIADNEAYVIAGIEKRKYYYNTYLGYLKEFHWDVNTIVVPELNSDLIVTIINDLYTIYYNESKGGPCRIQAANEFEPKG